MPDTAKRTQILVPVFLTLGLVAAGVWTNTLGSSVDLLPQGAESLTGTLSANAFRFGRLLVAILFLLFARHIPAIQNPLVAIAVLVMSVGAAMLVISYHQTLVDPLTLALAGVLIAIAAYSFVVWVFYLHFAQHIATSLTVWCIAISLVLEVACSVMVSLFFSSAAQMAVVIATPLVVGVLYFLAVSSAHKDEPAAATPFITGGYNKYALLMQVVIITIALVFVQALSSAGTWGEVRNNAIGMVEFSAVRLAIITVAIGLLTFLVFHLPRKRLSLSLRCIIGLATILAGMQILALSSDLQYSEGFEAVTVAIEEFSHLVRWMMVIECVRLIAMPPYRIAGIAHATSAIILLLWMHFISQLELATNTFVMIVVYMLLLVVVAILVIGYVGKSTTIWMAEGANEAAALDAFAKRWDLSTRETEIFVLLMQGRKRAEIEIACGLSEGTVKTHISNIYRKLDVHSKLEMQQLYKNSGSPAESG